MIFETHAHYDDEAFDEDRDNLIKSFREAGIGTVVNIGASVQGARNSVALASQYDFVYAAIGYHPDDGADATEADYAWLLDEGAKNEKVVAIGEIGLDYHWVKDEDLRKAQQEGFGRQIEIAKTLHKPIVIHSRDAAEDTYQVLTAHHGEEVGGVMHCFGYSVEEARRYVKLGFYIGVGGVVTFKNGRKLKEVVEEIPLSSIVLETDSPYLAPEPNRGKRNDSRNLVYIAAEIARLKGVSLEEVIAVTEANAKQMYFKIK